MQNVLAEWSSNALVPEVLNWKMGVEHSPKGCKWGHEIISWFFSDTVKRIHFWNYNKKRAEKLAEPDQLEYLKPFKSSAEIEAERLRKDLEESKNETGWRSRFRVPGKPSRLLPSLKTMKSNL